MSTSTLTPSLLLRLNTLKVVVKGTATENKLEAAFQASDGKFSSIAEAAHLDGVTSDEIKKIDFADSLATVTNDNEKLVTKFCSLPELSNMREFAFKTGKTAMMKLIKVNEIPKEITGKNSKERKMKYARVIHNRIYRLETSAVLHRMTNDNELPFADEKYGWGSSTFFANQPDFEIRTTSILTAFKNPDAFNGIDETVREGVVNYSKTLQRIQAISPSPEAVSHLIDTKLHTALQVALMSEKDFVKAVDKKIPAEEAKAIHYNATNVTIRNKHAMADTDDFLNGVIITND